MLEQYNALVLQIYEGATDASAWTRIVAAVAEYLEAEKGLLLTPFDSPAKGGFIFPYGIGQHHIELWKSRYLPEDLWARRMVERGLFYEGNVVLGRDIATREELLESTWYREFLSEMDIFQFISGIVFTAGRPSVPATGLPFYRGVDSPPFEEEHRERLRLLMPHITRSLGVMFKLRDADFRVAASLEALNRIRQGILLLDQRGCVCFANTMAEQILQRNDGLSLGEIEGSDRTLDTVDSLAQAALERAIQAAISAPQADGTHHTQTVLVRRTSEATHYIVQVSYLPETNPYHLGASAPRAVVFIKADTLVSQPEPGLLQRVYSLTPAEVRAALALCDGDSLDAVAAHLNVTLNTLKTHLKSIYAKTAVDSRAALTKLMLSLAQG
ncbi:helix-turn-helix transcriptional regulator [Steroidobacter flavus]|uniref:Helix-turn-helix transcriptional regulator n=1 Tax=Steroidobacter flavus TaxID=1842136 RepID=A0ABV8T5F0_9GAMM